MFDSLYDDGREEVYELLDDVDSDLRAMLALIRAIEAADELGDAALDLLRMMRFALMDAKDKAREARYTVRDVLHGESA